ncbi:hypothetical protein THMIRHAM_14800 [Thiomicrorhabdus immobilis]|uniref:Uncharacterized protein n=1 Tax=Thiomicrorhabdus immobilis TaxID=2791037 RepID=A0ABM7ME71_9GAMM|nr:hypothetical protein [Thiomicrorhabdus immobilis]BCN93695.1 hypothetical protein THMIRHAM_14800 [Thiomicrorhabdus immobilis]
MRYFRNNKNRKVFAIPAQQEFLIHIDWIEISQMEYESLSDGATFEKVDDRKVYELTPERINQINDRLLEIDIESIRPLRAITCNSGGLLDHQKLNALNDERKALLIELQNKNQR